MATWQGLGPTGHLGILKQQQVLREGDRSPEKGLHLNSGVVVLCQLDITHFLSVCAHTQKLELVITGVDLSLKGICLQ